MRAGLAQLAGTARESIARSMAVAGGQVIRDDAKIRAPKESGRLASAIYLAYKAQRSTDDNQIYSVSWNSRIAPHGHLIEFGHWQVYVTYRAPDGTFVSTGQKLPAPRWIPAQPFLRPALDGASSRAFEAMLKRGRERMFDLLADPDSLDEPV